MNEIIGVNDKKIVLINDIKFKSRKTSWNEIENALKGYVGKAYKIYETGKIIYIGSDFPDEFSHSKDSIILKGSIRKAKMNIANVIDKLVFSASGEELLPDYNKKHGRRAEHGWSRFNVYFGMAIYENDKTFSHYNYYSGKLIVRHNRNNKSYLYDIVRIKKENI